jgi:hypothetical protein
MATIPPIKFVIWGMVYSIVVPTLVLLLWVDYGLSITCSSSYNIITYILIIGVIS